MADIFLSYVREDLERAKVLVRALEEQGWTVWWDRTLRPGQSFDEIIGKELDAARCVMSLWSHTSLKSDWVKDEAAEGKRRNILVSVLLDRVLPPLGYRQQHAADLGGWDGDAHHPEFALLAEGVAAHAPLERRADRADLEPAEAPTNVVMVLPFINTTREPADDWIGLGILETVTADLKSIKELSLIGREQVFDALRTLGSSGGAADDERLSIAVGRQLRATWLVSGGYQRLGDVIRITARSVEVGSGAVVRTVKIDGAIGDIFSLQDKIVYELSQGMAVTYSPSARGRR